MTINVRDLRFYGSGSMPDDNTATNIGGAISLTKQIVFVTVAGLVQAVSDDSADTTAVTVSYRDAGQVIQTEVHALTGLTPVLYTATMARLLKATKAGSTVGNVAVEGQTASRSGTAQAGTADSITLDAGASAVDGFYRSQVIRLTGGTGVGQIRRIVAYEGVTRIALVSRVFSPAPNATTTFRVSPGIMFERLPTECLEVRRLHYDAAADALGGAARDYYDKCFVKNLSTTDSLTNVTISEDADPEAQFDFALETTKNGTGSNGVGNTRLIAPSAGVTAFDGTSKAVPSGGALNSGDTIGLWSHLALPAGDGSTDTKFSMQVNGT